MKNERYAFLASGTGIDYREGYKILTPRNQEELNQYLKQAAMITGLNDVVCLSKEAGDSLADQIRNYSLNCVMIDNIKENEINPCYVAGYSMGIYSALYAGNSIDYKTGVELISMAFRNLEQCLAQESALAGKMGSIIGLRKDEVSALLTELDPGGNRVMLANVNNEHSIVISGYAEEVKNVLLSAESEGAIKVSEIEVSFPYHSSLVSGASAASVQQLENFILKKLTVPMISTIDFRLICDIEDIKCELARNLSSPISWWDTMLTLEELGIRNFIEISETKILQKIGRFINPDFKFLTYREIMHNKESI